MINRILGGRYQIVSSVGEGGMSRVFCATDLNTGKMVAVKVLRDEYREDETFVRRFEREAQAASRMTHPNIANLLDVGVEEDGTRYLVIEYVSGKTLKQAIVEGGPLRPETAAQIIIRVLAAVQHAHQNGVIHRDIKPQNILIDREGTVKVTDFGIARVANTQTMNQEEDTVMGSVYYFSPEQARGAAVDEKSDLYSVGVVFYEMLTGQVPFTGETPVAIAMQHLQKEPLTPSEINPAISPALDFVVLHAMEKRPRNRYASAADMQRDVRLALEHPDTILAARAEAERREREARAKKRRQATQEKRRQWTRRALIVLFSLFLLGLTAVAGYRIMGNILTTRQSRVEVPNVIGMQSADAIDLLIADGLDPNFRYDWYDLVQEDVVADQSIAPGTIVEKGAKITIAICRSTFGARMPNVTNIPYNDAVTILSNLGIVVGTVEQTVSQAEYGLVLAQSIESGTAVNAGETVNLVISGGSVVMPDLMGMSREQVTQTLYLYSLQLSGNGFVEVQVDDPALVERVIDQTPEAYREIKRDSTVTIEIGIPSNALFGATVALDLSEVPVGATVAVRVVEEDGSETTAYSKTIEKQTDEVKIQVFSRTAREGLCQIYINDELRESKPVIFSK